MYYTWRMLEAGIPRRKKTTSVRLFLFLSLTALIPFTVFADVIYLKNGRKIVAQVTQEDSKQVVYSVKGGELSIPKSMVDHIERSADAVEPPPSRPSENSQEKARDVPLPALPSGETSSVTDSPVIKDGAVDEAYLLHLGDELAHNPSAENARLLKQGYQQAALFQAHNGDPEGAIQKYQQALKLLPNDLSLTLALGYLLVTQSHYLEAVDLLLPASDLYPKSADVVMLLGSAFYGMENLDEAIAQWNKALALQDNSRLRDAISKAERERDIAGYYRELHSEHFLPRYGGEPVEKLSGQVLGRAWRRRSRTSCSILTIPRARSLSSFFTLIRRSRTSPARRTGWARSTTGKFACLSGLTQMTAELARVLKHELTHSFVRQITMGHCPTWFNEGLAQLEEGDTTARLRLVPSLAEKNESLARQ